MYSTPPLSTSKPPEYCLAEQSRELLPEEVLADLFGEEDYQNLLTIEAKAAACIQRLLDADFVIKDWRDRS